MEDRAVLAATKHTDSGVWQGVQICLAPRDKAEDFLDMARDANLASHSDAYHGPNALAPDHRIHDGAKDSHLYPLHLAIQRKVVVDHIQEQPRVVLTVWNRLHTRASMDSAVCADGPGRLPLPFCRATPLSCATYLADLFGVRTHQLLSVEGHLIVVERLVAAIPSGWVVLVMGARWLEVRAHSRHPSIADRQDAQSVQPVLVD